MCFEEGTGKTTRPPLQPIPVGGLFHRVGVDILQLPTTFEGNKCAVVFLDYLTKWAGFCGTRPDSSDSGYTVCGRGGVSSWHSTGAFV